MLNGRMDLGHEILAVEAEHVIIEVASKCSSKERTLAAVSLKYSPWNWVSNCAIGEGWCYIFNTSNLHLPIAVRKRSRIASALTWELSSQRVLDRLSEEVLDGTMEFLPTGYCKNVIERCVQVQIRVEHHVEDVKNHLNHVLL